VTSGSVISSSVGSVGIYGCSATMLVSSASLCAVLVKVGVLFILGDMAMSDPLVDSYLLMAIVRVYTIFQVFKDCV
jgi:hypothetical protein